MDYKKEYYRIMSLVFDYKISPNDPCGYFDFDGAAIDQFVDAIDLFVDVEKMPEDEREFVISVEHGYETEDEFFATLQAEISNLHDKATEKAETEFNEENGNRYYGTCCPNNTWADFNEDEIFNYIF